MCLAYDDIKQGASRLFRKAGQNTKTFYKIVYKDGEDQYTSTIYPGRTKYIKGKWAISNRRKALGKKFRAKKTSQESGWQEVNHGIHVYRTLQEAVKCLTVTDIETFTTETIIVVKAHKADYVGHNIKEAVFDKVKVVGEIEIEQYWDVLDDV